MLYALFVFSIGYTFFFFQAEDGIRDLVRSRGLGDVYKRQQLLDRLRDLGKRQGRPHPLRKPLQERFLQAGPAPVSYTHLTLPTSDLVEISVVAVSLKKKNT